MRPTRVLLAWALRRDRATLLALAAALALFNLLFVLLARYLEASRSFDRLATLMPDFVTQILGFDARVLLGFAGIIGFGYFHPAVIAMLVAAAVVAGRGPVSELEGRTAELLVARPIRRSAIPLASLAEVAILAVALPGVMVSATLVTLAALGRAGAIAPVTLGRLGAASGALVACFGSLFVALSTACARTRSYTRTAVGVALGSYVVDYLARLWTPLGPLARLSIFHHLQPLAVLVGRPTAADAAGLAALVLVASLVALVVFEQRDL